MNRQGNFSRFVITSVVLFAFVAIGFLAGRSGEVPSIDSTAYAAPPAKFWESATGGKSMSMATGLIEDGVEGVFGLDHLTGDLFCWIISPLSGEVATTFRVNVAADLAITGDADYVMTTGLMDFRIASTGSDRIAYSVVYVGDGNSGRAVGYGLSYDRQAISNGDPAGGELKLICEMLTRAPGTVRDQGTKKSK